MADKIINNTEAKTEDFSSFGFLKSLLSKLCEKGSSCFGSSVPFFKGIALCGPSGCGKTFLIGELYQKCRELGYSCVGINPFDKKDENETLSTVLGEMKRHPVFIWIESDPDDWGYFIHRIKAAASSSGTAIIITEFEDFSEVESKAKRFFTPFSMLLPSSDERKTFFKANVKGANPDDIKALEVRTKDQNFYTLCGIAEVTSVILETKSANAEDLNSYISVISSSEKKQAEKYISYAYSPANIPSYPPSNPVSGIDNPVSFEPVSNGNELDDDDLLIDMPSGSKPELAKMVAPIVHTMDEIGDYL